MWYIFLRYVYAVLLSHCDVWHHYYSLIIKRSSWWRFSTNNWHSISATFQTTQGVPAEIARSPNHPAKNAKAMQWAHNWRNSHIPQCICSISVIHHSEQNCAHFCVHISVLNDASWDMEQMHCGIYENGPLLWSDDDLAVADCTWDFQHDSPQCDW